MDKITILLETLGKILSLVSSSSCRQTLAGGRITPVFDFVVPLPYLQSVSVYFNMTHEITFKAHTDDPWQSLLLKIIKSVTSIKTLFQIRYSRIQVRTQFLWIAIIQPTAGSIFVELLAHDCLINGILSIFFWPRSEIPRTW